MSVELTLRGVTPDELSEDVYFAPDYVALHAMEDPIESIVSPTFKHAAAVRKIPDSDLMDLESPWGFGGPVARDHDALSAGMAQWRERQHRAGYVAEFVRLHPFLNPFSLIDHFDLIRFDRATVLVDLTISRDDRQRGYDRPTRRRLKRARENLSIREVGPDEAAAVKGCYDAGLRINAAKPRYEFSEDFFRELMAKPWCTTWMVSQGNEPVAAGCFLHRGKFAHTHLSGGTERARAVHAHYLLHDHAIDHYAALGCFWFHLGGGRTSSMDDALLHFKSKFSPLRAHYYVGGLIFDADRFFELSGHDRFPNRGPILCYRFPPAKDAAKGPVTLRPATEEDYPQFFRLKCDPANIYWSGHAAPPDWIGLNSWFNAQLANPQSRIYLAERDGEALGYAYVKSMSENIIESSLGVDSAYAGNGVGREILRQLTGATGRAGTGNAAIEAWIFPDNAASIKAHEAAGYRFVSDRAPRPMTMPLAEQPREQRLWTWQPGQHLS